MPANGREGMEGGGGEGDVREGGYKWENILKFMSNYIKIIEFLSHVLILGVDFRGWKEQKWLR